MGKDKTNKEIQTEFDNLIEKQEKRKKRILEQSFIIMSPWNFYFNYLVPEKDIKKRNKLYFKYILIHSILILFIIFILTIMPYTRF